MKSVAFGTNCLYDNEISNYDDNYNDINTTFILNQSFPIMARKAAKMENALDKYWNEKNSFLVHLSHL